MFSFRLAVGCGRGRLGTRVGFSFRRSVSTVSLGAGLRDDRLLFAVRRCLGGRSLCDFRLLLLDDLGGMTGNPVVVRVVERFKRGVAAASCALLGMTRIDSTGLVVFLDYEGSVMC